jgi:hypothetical protein
MSCIHYASNPCNRIKWVCCGRFITYLQCQVYSRRCYESYVRWPLLTHQKYWCHERSFRQSFCHFMSFARPPLWSSDQEFLATDPEVRVRSLALPHYLRSGGSGTWSIQPREYNWGAIWKKKIAARVYKTENTAFGIRHADHAIPSIRKIWH